MKTADLNEEEKKDTILRFSDDVLLKHALASEYAEVCRHPVDGIFVTPSQKDDFCWFGVIFIRKGIFGGGVFRFTIKIPTDFPTTKSLPEVIFENSIFHPLIEWKTKVLDLTRSFPDGWKCEKHNLLRVLIVVQRIFFSYEFDCDRCINPEAAILYKEHKDKFKEMAKDVVEISRSQVYDDPQNPDDSNSISLTPWDPSIHEKTRKKMMIIGKSGLGNGGVGEDQKTTSAAEFRREREIRENGAVMIELVGKHFPKTYSWFDPEEMTVLTRDDKKCISSHLSSARMDREKHGIEPLDLSAISPTQSVANSPHQMEPRDLSSSSSSSDRRNEIERNLANFQATSNEESVI
ncbi:unnamed protein product [Caenorhabditis angaria]|uniref:UBC core domain-containing protein n=1 Tax=Caenorhabditis angaria TaxID=860376 RepID=A0A9P1N845_9PELO|nr:unnamed protein product [Caenorhabditis angaria]